MYLWCQSKEFLDFYLTEREIEANLDQCDIILKMETSSSKEWVMKLIGMLTSLNRFLSRSTQHTLPFYTLLSMITELKNWLFYYRKKTKVVKLLSFKVIC
jgi:hypothetical protein